MSDPRDEYLSQIVKGKSFADVGGLWVHSKRKSVSGTSIRRECLNHDRCCSTAKRRMAVI